MMDVMFIWMWYVAVTEPNKLVICGSIVECYTQQKGYLPSAMKNTLGKADTWQNFVHSRAKMTSLPSVWLGKEGMFAECQRLDTRRRDQKLGLEWLVFAEWLGCDTRQTWIICRVSGPGHSTNIDYLPSVMAGALGKQCHVCRVPRPLDTQ